MDTHDEISNITRETGAIVRVGMQAATRLAEQMARSREAERRRAEQQSTQATRELEQRLNSERAAAEAQLRAVLDDQWWDRADSGQIADNYQSARAWQNESPAAARAAERIEEEVTRRYGVDPSTALHRATIDRLLREAEARRKREKDEHDNARTDDLTASALMAEADRADGDEKEQATLDTDLAGTGNETEPFPGPVNPSPEGELLRDAAHTEWDSAERRAKFADDMRAVGIDAETIAARITADLDEATHPRNAVAQGGPKRAPRARKGHAQASKDSERAMGSR
ncbi:hypothetical protein ACFTWF_35035 [Rhodococcus sp. NPDC056960]|uniref:hypothetical protein n=1 Tax=Rhodococcus sp. NPDC056960 TaxID=3345982 RepID=UPI0036252B4F